MAFMALIPGLPHLPFLILAAVLGGISWQIYALERSAVAAKQKKAEADKLKPAPEKLTLTERRRSVVVVDVIPKPMTGIAELASLAS